MRDSPVNAAPSLETERLILRPYRKDDFAAISAIWADPVIQLYTTGRDLTQEETWARTLRNAGLWPLLGFGYWAVEEKSSGDLVGEVGFADFKREMQPSIEGVPEAGWILASRFHGKGYATEAVRAALSWRDEYIVGSQTMCVIQEGNAASIRVAEKCGFREQQRTQYKDHEIMIFLRQT